VRVLVAFAVLVDEVGATAVDVDGAEMVVVVVVVVDFAARSVRDVEAAVEIEPRVSLPCVA
jgi:hypothetical protein